MITEKVAPAPAAEIQELKEQVKSLHEKFERQQHAIDDLLEIVKKSLAEE